MILRVCRAKINPARLEAYRRFEAKECLPMLHRQPGLLGVLFLRQLFGSNGTEIRIARMSRRGIERALDRLRSPDRTS